MEIPSKHCVVCGTVFFKQINQSSHYWIDIRRFCSKRCMGLGKKGRKSYERTPEHIQKMKTATAHIDQTKNRIRFIEINKGKIGKSIETLYGKDKAEKLRENLKRQTGEKNPNWRGGMSKIPYPKEFNKKLKNYIKERDRLRCQICDEPESTLRDKDILRRGLDVDHIDHDKNNNKESNLIALCRKCNGQKNSHPDWQRSLQERAISNSLGA